MSVGVHRPDRKLTTALSLLYWGYEGSRSQSLAFPAIIAFTVGVSLLSMAG